MEGFLCHRALTNVLSILSKQVHGIAVLVCCHFMNKGGSQVNYHSTKNGTETFPHLTLPIISKK